jgi:hypothetical protein
MMTDPICMRSNPAWTVDVRRVTRSMAFFVADSEGASSERSGVLTEETDDAIGFRLCLSLPCTTSRGVVE